MVTDWRPMLENFDLNVQTYCAVFEKIARRDGLEALELEALAPLWAVIETLHDLALELAGGAIGPAPFKAPLPSGPALLELEAIGARILELEAAWLKLDALAAELEQAKTGKTGPQNSPCGRARGRSAAQSPVSSATEAAPRKSGGGFSCSRKKERPDDGQTKGPTTKKPPADRA